MYLENMNIRSVLFCPVLFWRVGPLQITLTMYLALLLLLLLLWSIVKYRAKDSAPVILGTCQMSSLILSRHVASVV